MPILPMAHRLLQAAQDSRFEKPPVLVFIHLPKTGGTSLNNFIHEGVCGRSFLFGSMLAHFLKWQNPGKNYLRDFLALSSPEKDQLDAVSGHIPPGIHLLMSRPCVYTILLRDPLRRIVSFYFHNKSRKNASLHKEIKNRKISLEKFVEKISGERKFCDEMTKRIMDFDLLDRTWNWLQLSRMKTRDIVQLREQLSQKWCDPITPEIMQQTKEKLRDQFMLVGITERFNDFALLLSQKMNWESIPKIQKLRELYTIVPKYHRAVADIPRRSNAIHLFQCPDLCAQLASLPSQTGSL